MLNCIIRPIRVLFNELWRLSSLFWNDESTTALCVGLDPHLSDLKEPTAASVRDFCLRLVKTTAPYAAAFKPNAAFFEVFAADGWSALMDVIVAIRAESYLGELG